MCFGVEAQLTEGPHQHLAQSSSNGTSTRPLKAVQACGILTSDWEVVSVGGYDCTCAVNDKDSGG